VEEAKILEGHPGYGPQSRALIQALRDGKPGDVKTDIELASVCGRDTRVGGPGYGHLQSAIQFCERDGVVWKRLVKQNAIRCVGGTDLMDVARTDLKQIHRKCKRTTRRLGAVDPAELSDDERRKHGAMLAQSGTLALFSRKETQDQLEDERATQPLDQQKLLAWFQDS